jgi:hypothetical protein
MEKSEAFDSSLKKTFDECCEGEGWEIEFDKEFDPIEHWQGDKWVTDKLKHFISSLLAKQQEEFVKMIEDRRPNACDCVGGEYNCEHWGKHELIDDVIADIKSKLNKEAPAYIGGVNLATNDDNEISSRLAVTDRNIGMLRQWLNEKDPERMVTNRDIKDWLDIK